MMINPVVRSSNMMVYDAKILWSYMIIKYDDHIWHHIWDRRNGLHPESDNMTGNYYAKLTFSPKPWNDPMAYRIISIKALSQQRKRNCPPGPNRKVLNCWMLVDLCNWRHISEACVYLCLFMCILTSIQTYVYVCVFMRIYDHIYTYI